MPTRSIQRLERISDRDFHEHFWSRREPLIFAGAPAELLRRYEGWRAEAIFARLRSRIEAVSPQQLWYDLAEGIVLDRRDLPSFVAAHVYGPGHITREKHYRLFFHARGHVTGLHYEGNLLDVFSQQLKGRKRWRLLNGNVAHKLLPFYFVDNQATYDPMGSPPEWTYDFELREGELLFLPRGWYHQVECLTDDNVALSVVAAPTDTAAFGARTLEIYREQLALQYHLRAVLPQRFSDKIQTLITYDARGLAWAKHYVAEITLAAMVRRLGIDLCVVTPSMLASALRHRRTLAYVGYLSKFERDLKGRLDRV